MTRILWAAFLGTFLISCNKEPGEGGKAEIRGRLMETETNANGTIIRGPYTAIDEKVFIVYGEATDGAYPDDDVDTGPNGEFRFPWLRKGKYTIYAIGDSYSTPSGKVAVSVSVEINDRKGVVETGDIHIIRKP